MSLLNLFYFCYSCPTARSIWSGTNEGQGQRNVQVQKQEQIKGKTKFWSNNGASMFTNVLCHAMCYYVTYKTLPIHNLYNFTNL